MIRTLIVDDEPPARSRLRRLLAEVEDCEIVAEAGSGKEALSIIEQQSPDLVLLDISMPGMDGMTLAGVLDKQDQPPEVVFCTAWPDQALEAFERSAIDYLVKPVSIERLEKAIAKVRRVMESRPARDAFLRSTVGGKTALIPINEVICLVAEDKYTTVWFESGKTVINESLVELERQYSDRLLRIHRNTLVMASRIRGLERQSSGKCLLLLEHISMKPEVSRRQLPAVRRLIRELG